VVQGLKYSEIYILTFSKNVLLIYLDISSAPEKTMHPHCSWWQSRISLLSQSSTLQLSLDSPPKPVIKGIIGKKTPHIYIMPFAICQRFPELALFSSLF